ncbi:MAG: hypothetical protein R2806_02555 [Saprospiraceae bacterium]
MGRKAVIDLGTNTFHLLIVEPAGPSLHAVHKERVYVKLGADGIQTLSSAAMERGVQTLSEFARKLKDFDVEAYRAIGTAALRTASNSAEFLARVNQQTGLHVEVISPRREASLISDGIKMDVPLDQLHLSLMLDIGGGSVESIFHRYDKYLEADSYPVGVAVLHGLFHHSDPLHPTEGKAIRDHLMTYYAPLIEKYRSEKPVLIGASGSFEVLDDYFSQQNPWASSDVLDVCNEIISMDRRAREAHPAIPSERVGYIVMACALIRFILEEFQVPEVWYTPFALKEGVLAGWYPGRKLILDPV